MEKIRLTLAFLLILVLSGNKLTAQDDDFIRQGLISGRMTLAPSYAFSDHRSYFYLHGNLEGYLNKHLSVAGESYLYLEDQAMDISPIDFNHNFFFGVSGHLVKKKNDLYIGFQPGISFTKLNAAHYNLAKTSMGINPVASLVVGYNLYFYKFFHFFLQARIIAGQHNYDVNKDLTEFRFSAGLGINLNTMKKKASLRNPK